MGGRLFNHRLPQLVVLLLILAAGIYAQIDRPVVLNRLSSIGFDYYNRLMKRNGTDHAIIVDIDEESIRRHGQWPWPRTLVADLTTKLAEQGAAVIVYDIVFAERDRTSPAICAANITKAGGGEELAEKLKSLPDHDDVLAAAVARAGNVVTGFVGSQQGSDDLPQTKHPMGFDERALHKLSLIQSAFALTLDQIVEAAAGNGCFSMRPDDDGLIRRVPLFSGAVVPSKKTDNVFSPLLPSLAIEALMVKQKGRLYQIKTEEDPHFLTSLAQTLDNVFAMLGMDYRTQEDPDLLTSLAQTLDNAFAMLGMDYRTGFEEGPDLSIKGVNIISPNPGGPKKKFFIPTDERGDFIVHYAGNRPELYVPAWKVMANQAENYSFAGKIVFIGTSTIGLLDLRATPLDNILPGVEVHAEIVDQILNNRFLVREDSTKRNEMLATAAAGLIVILLAPMVGTIAFAMFTLGLIGLGVSYCVYSYQYTGQLYDATWPSIILLTLFILSSIFSNLRTEMEKRMIRQAFSHYLSPVLIAELAKNPEKLRLGGEVRDLSVMFTDIRNFTTISESMEPAELIRMMNDFLTPMTSAVLDNRGTVDKYMGDAMMAFWNAPLDDQKHAENACRTALLMVASLAPVNDNLKARMEAAGKPFRELKAGIGINSGTASVGNMGSKQRFAYSALGDTVNLASRIEGQTKGYGISIMISDSVRRAAPQFAAIEIDLLTVKGRKEPERVHALLGDEAEATSPEFAAFASLHAGMLAAYRAQDWDKAAEQADACATERPELFLLYKLYKERIIAYRENPPPADWGGVWVAKDK